MGTKYLAILAFAACILRSVTAAPSLSLEKDVRHGVIAPKVVIISMFSLEAAIWPEQLGLYARNITTPGLSPEYPVVHCDIKGEICQLTTGEGEINAASTIMAFALSRHFDLSYTYFLIAGIAGVNPFYATTGSVTFARYAVQVALQYEIDIRELPSNYSTGYIPQHSTVPETYPETVYGTEVFEVNAALRDRAIALAKKATLNDTVEAAAYREKYNYSPANQPPAVVACDTATSDVYFSGNLLSESFGNYTAVLTNGTGVYCSSQQEDNATLESLLRADSAGLVDFSRIIIMRAGSDFDRPPPSETAAYHLLEASQSGTTPALENLYLAGVQIINDVKGNWTDYKYGIKPDNYVGDILNSSGSTTVMDFGPGSSD
ncbi:Purine nucleoside permease [Penicillium camemberti]|uniref:Purine nucleoside permease n=1 Tax=Penicillium camemberti (strain FM 013) TaxID=1429867 RepID=A0A0G4NZE5_PENC3|nr:Purine nucleoside permease [Penicillium camemberti]